MTSRKQSIHIIDLRQKRKQYWKQKKRLGDKSITAINSIAPDTFLNEYHKLQRAFYQAIVDNNSSQKVFLKGWLNRVLRKEEYIKGMEA